MDASACYEARMLVDRLKGVRDEIYQTMQLIEGLCQTIPDNKLLLTIPGFGAYMAAPRYYRPWPILFVFPAASA